MYNQEIFERFLTHKNAGIIKKADGIGVVKLMNGNDEIKVFLKVENGVILDAKYKVFGGVSAIVSADIAMDLIKNKAIDDALLMNEEDINQSLGGLPVQKIQTAQVVVSAIANAVKNYRKKMIKLAIKK
ncbi:MAG: iron-sulfur cluster assembly scaffold protein [Clostridia bacterium]|nr:iron-sulfur cluster assembly scaffold protein [Clostridia bacterium]